MTEKIQVQQLSSTEYSVSFEIPAEEVDKKFDEYVESIKDKAQIPGFRQGKVPTTQLKKFLGQKVRAPVSQLLISEYYAKLLQEHNISPVGNPNIKNLDPKAKYLGRFAFDGSFSLEFTVDVIPKIDPSGYKGLEVTIPQIDTDTLFNKKMMEYREQFAERSQIKDRGAIFGDTLIIDFKGYLDGAAFDGGSAQGHSINKLGQANLIPGFEDQLVGMKAGENKKIKVTFPQSYGAAHLAGKEAEFDIVVHNIVESKLADVNEDLAMMIGYSSVEDLNSKVKEDVEKVRQEQVKQIINNQISMKIIENNKFDVPRSMINNEINRLRKMFKVEKIDDTIFKQLSMMAENNVKRAIVVDAIYEKEKETLEIKPDELKQMLEQQAKSANKTVDEVVSALYNSNQMDGFISVLKASKVVDFIINNLKTTESEKK